jgi:hypothetical protein
MLEQLAPQIFADIRGYDHCDRLIAHDWVGRVGLIFPGPPLSAAQAGWKLTARLRAPGIRRVEIVPRPGRPPLAEDEIRWVFCDEFAAEPGLWATIGSEVLHTNPAQYTGNWLRDEIYAPFQVAGAALDWDDMAARLRARFLATPEIQQLLASSDSFEAASVTASITDIEAPTGTSDDKLELPLLPALNAAATDPVVARLLGLYGHSPANPDLAGRDWRVRARPPFAEANNLERLDDRLRGILDPGGPFFLVSDALTELELAGLVLDATESVKPAPPKPDPTLTPQVHLVPDRQNGARHLVRAEIGAAPDTVETDPTRVNASYEVVRELTGEAPANVVADTDSGPLDDIGILPDVLVPEFERATCLSTGRLHDVFSRDAFVDRELAYLVRGFDIFGRPSDPATTPTVALPAACLPPPPPGSISAHVAQADGLLRMTVDIEIETVAEPAQADWQALELLVHSVPLTEGVAPGATTWAGTRPGRLIELGFDASNALQLSPVQLGCRQLSWSGGSLDHQPEVEAVCAAAFAGGVTVEPHPTATPPPGLKTYRLSLGLGARAQYPDGLNAWCARAQIRGHCPHSGALKQSPEVAVRATLLLPPPPPAVIQPEIAALPLSTYPDALGTSYYSVDLRTVLSPADQAAGAFVRLYLARLEALTDAPGDFVQGGSVIDPPGLVALARQSRGRFALVTDPPEAFDPDRPQADIAVPGDLEEVYIAAVVGTSGMLKSGSWQGAAILPFRTPPVRPRPLLEWRVAGAEAQGGAIHATLALAARFSEPLPDPTKPPAVQLLRRSLSEGGRQSRFLVTVQGQSDDPTAAHPEFRFDTVDEGLIDWQRYEYAAQLLVFAPDRAQYVKTGGRETRAVVAPFAGSRDPLEGASLQVSANPAGGFFVELTLAAGDFDLSIEKRPDAGNARTIAGRIEAGSLFLPAELPGTLTLGPSYALRLVDSDPAPGLYRVRLRFRQALTVSREARTP